MALPIPALSVLIDLANQVANGEEFADLASGIQASVADLVEAHNRVKLRLEAISTVNGALSGVTNAQGMALAGAYRSTGGVLAAITTAIPYDAAFTVNSVVVSENGLILDTTAYSLSNSGGFLVVTMSVPPIVSDVYVIRAFSIGAGVLASLASITTGQGAALVGIEDAALNTAATTVEGALADLFSKVTSASGTTYLEGLLTLADYVKRDGSVAMTGALPMGANKITGLADGTATTDAATFGQLTAYLSAISGFFNLAILKNGTTVFAADQSMGGHKLTNVAAPAAGEDATNKTYVDAADAVVTAAWTAAVATISGDVGSRLAYFTANGSFVVPTGVTRIRCRGWGAGAAGENETGYSHYPRAAAGGAGGFFELSVAVTPGESLTVSIGAGGTTLAASGTATSILRGAAVLGQANGATGTTGGSAVVNSPATGYALAGGNGAVSGIAWGSSPSAGIGGSGGSSPFGGVGAEGAKASSEGSSDRARPGGFPGGGGGGGGGATPFSAGADGFLTITY